MKVKGSIAVFAVAAAFAGQVAAYDQTCRDLIGSQAFTLNASTPVGAWQIAEDQTGWQSGKFIDCTVPKNKKGQSYLFKQIDPNLCSTYNSLMSADQKYIGKTPADAWDILQTYRTTKLLAWYGVNKVDQKTFETVDAAVAAAQKCIADSLIK